MIPMTLIAQTAFVAAVITQIMLTLYLAYRLLALEAEVETGVAQIKWRMANARVEIAHAGHQGARPQDSFGPHTHSAVVVFPSSPEVLSHD